MKFPTADGPGYDDDDIRNHLDMARAIVGAAHAATAVIGVGPSSSEIFIDPTAGAGGSGRTIQSPYNTADALSYIATSLGPSNLG